MPGPLSEIVSTGDPSRRPSEASTGDASGENLIALSLGQLNALVFLRFAFEQSFRGRRDRRDRGSKLVGHVGNEAPPHRLGARQARHVPEDPDSPSPRAARERQDVDLPRDFIRPLPDEGLFPARVRVDRLPKQLVDPRIANDVDERSAGRVGAFEHFRKGAVRLDDLRLLPDDDETRGEPVERRGGQLSLRFRRRERGQQRALHAANGLGKGGRLRLVLLGRVAREIASRHRKRGFGHSPQRGRESSARQVSDQEKHEARSENRRAPERKRPGLVGLKPIERIGEPNEPDRRPGRVDTVGEIDEIEIQRRRKTTRGAGALGSRIPDLRAVRVVLHVRDLGRRDLAVGDDAAVGTDRRDARPQGPAGRADERVEPGFIAELRRRQPGEQGTLRRKAIDRPRLRSPIE